MLRRIKKKKKRRLGENPAITRCPTFIGVKAHNGGCSGKERRLHDPGYVRWCSSQRWCPSTGVHRQRGSPPLLREPPASPPPLSWPWAPGSSCTPWLWAAGWRCCWPCSFPGTCWCWSRWAGRWPWRWETRGGEKVTSPVAASELKLSMSCSCGNMKTGIADHVKEINLTLRHSPEIPKGA